ncbi:hypothetical protein KM043_005892 [Ampulex compressa]|nr:hypothetical protein KM043_005892 [Ampulex compressa]
MVYSTEGGPKIVDNEPRDGRVSSRADARISENSAVSGDNSNNKKLAAKGKRHSRRMRPEDPEFRFEATVEFLFGEAQSVHNGSLFSRPLTLERGRKGARCVNGVTSRIPPRLWNPITRSARPRGLVPVTSLVTSHFPAISRLAYRAAPFSGLN